MKTPKNLLENTAAYRKTPKGLLTNLYHKMKERNIKKGFGKLPFSLTEFHKLYIESDIYLLIFNNWAENGYAFYKRPSIDRKNPNMGYELNNIQMMTWEENRRKGDKENSRHTTSVVMCDFDGNIIKEFESIKLAVEATGLSQGNIIMCCQGKRRHTGGYVFKYRGDKFRKNK